MSDEATYTYTVMLSTGSPWAGCNSEDVVGLGEFGYSDQDWDALSENAQNYLLDEWAQENFWEKGYEFYAEVEK